MIATWVFLGLTLAGAPSPSTPLTSTSGNRSVVAVGEGRAPANVRGSQAKLMARRAAEVVALRNLARELKLPASTVVRGFRFVSVVYNTDGSAIVTVEWRSST